MATEMVTYVLVAVAVLLCLIAVNSALGKPIPFLRWSFLRMGFSARRIITHGEVGDGREAEAGEYILRHAQRGDLDGVLRAFDRYGHEEKFLISVGDRKGQLLDDVIRREKPRCVLELGTFLGYSALRIARAMPASSHVYTIERNAKNAEIARRLIDHAGASERITVIVGSLADERTVASLRDHGLTRGSVSVLFLDHDKNAYVTDLSKILDEGFLQRGSVVLADNILVPGAPAYVAFIEAGEGSRWSTRVHRTKAEYQSVLPDVMLESTVL